ncbi:MAG: ribosome recycling factor [Flavobacteriales bacterium]|nr:ribosome recycling factor [Flavobacteriales bacterium]
MNDELNMIISIAEEQMNKTIDHAQDELQKIRAGKANPQMVEGVKVDYYGVETPLSQVANVNTPDPQTIAIQPWEKAMIGPIETAIVNANLGFNPSNDGTFVRINVPTLTEERRIDLVKQAKAATEHCKVSIRNCRRDSNEDIKKLVKDGLAEDNAKDGEVSVQQLTDKFIAQMDETMEAKEKEILTV